MECNKLIIYCIKDVYGETYSLNKCVAESLINVEEEKRAIQIQNILYKIIDNIPEDAVLKNFDILFNPKLKIDVLRVFIELYKHKRFAMLWPGIIEDGKLKYAEQEYEDYNVFDVENYDIVCVR